MSMHIARILKASLGAIAVLFLTQCTTLSQQMASNAPAASTPLIPCVDQNPVAYMSTTGWVELAIQHGFPNPITITDVTTPASPVVVQKFDGSGLLSLHPAAVESYQVSNTALASALPVQTDTLRIVLPSSTPHSSQVHQFTITETSANPNYQSQGASQPLQISAAFFGPVQDMSPVRFAGTPAMSQGDGSCPANYVVPIAVASLWAQSQAANKPSTVVSGWAPFADNDPYGPGQTYTAANPFPAPPEPHSYFPNSVVVPGPTVSFVIPTYTYQSPGAITKDSIHDCSIGQLNAAGTQVPYNGNCYGNGQKSTYFEAKLQIEAANGSWSDVPGARAGLVQGGIGTTPVSGALELTGRLPNVVNVLRVVLFSRVSPATLATPADVDQLLSQPPLFVTTGFPGHQGVTYPLDFPNPTVPSGDSTKPGGATDIVAASSGEAAHDWQATPPFTVMVLPNGVAQLKVMPLAIIYAPPGACGGQDKPVSCTYANAGGTSSSSATNQSRELFAYTQSFGTTLSFGESAVAAVANAAVSSSGSTISLSTPSDLTPNLMTPNVFADGESLSPMTIPLPQLSWSEQQSQAQATGESANFAQGQTYQFAQLLSVTSNWTVIDPDIKPGDATAYDKEPFWDDTYILMVSPEFAFWDFGTPSGGPMTQSQFLSAQSNYWPVTVKELDQCVSGAATVTNPYDTGIKLSAAECTELLSLDPFYPGGNSAAIPRGSSVDQSRFVPLPSSPFGKLPNTNQPLSTDISTLISNSSTAGTQSSQVYNGTVTNSAATSTTTGLSFLYHKAGVSGSVTTGSSGSQGTSLQITYSGLAAETVQQTMQVTGQLIESDVEIVPNVYRDVIFGGILVQDPNSQKKP